MTYAKIIGASKPWGEYDRDRDEGPNGELARCVIETVQDIERRQKSIHDGHRRHARLYAGYLPGGLQQGAGPTTSARVPFQATKAVIRNICDTAHAMIVLTRPKASFVTDGADWDVQQQAEDMDKFCVGAFDRAGIYPVASRSFHDSTWAGTGGWAYMTKGSGDEFRVLAERCLIDDIIVDEDECREHLDPPTVYHRLTVRADVLIKRYCPGNSPREIEMRAAILKARGAWPNISVPADRVVLVRTFHLDQDGDNHRKVLAVSGCVLADEVWPHPWHPFTFLWWQLPITGFYGDGIAYRQYGLQERISYMYRWIHRCHELLATPTAWVDPAGGPPQMHMSNEIGRIIMTRRPPEFQVHQVVPPEIYRWLDELEASGYEGEGMNRQMASNQMAPGVDSAPAQREMVFNRGQRFAPVSQRWEEALGVEAATKIVGMYRHHMTTAKTKVKMKWADRKFIHQVDWPDLDENQYVIRPQASNLDSLSPAARTQSALELAQTGWLSPEEGRALLAHPDLQAADDLANAPTEYAKKLVWRMMKGEGGIPVDEHTDLAIVELVVKRGRMLCMNKNAPAEIVDEMARFLDRIDQVKQQMAQQMAMQQAAAGGMGGAPMPGGPQGAAGPTPAMAPPAPGSMTVPF
jgi:hypothetical protein